MTLKLGNTDAAIRLGSTTPAAAYLGSEQVWSAATVPGAPTNFADAVGYLIWNVPASDGGAAITGYKIYATGTDTGTSEVYDDEDVTALGTLQNPSTLGVGEDVSWFIPFTGTLSYTVSAINALGEGSKTEPREVSN